MWKLFVLFICVTLKLAFLVGQTQSTCSIKIPEDIKGYAPVILTSSKRNGYQLFKPTGAVTKFRSGSRLLLACTGNKNVFNNTDFDMLQLKCSEDGFVDLNNNIWRLKDTVCKSIPISILKTTNNKCSHGNGFIYKVGFSIQDNFIGPVFEICYNSKNNITLYSNSTINGAAINYTIVESSRRSFTADGMNFTTSATNSYYLKNNQIKRFKSTFGETQTYVDQRNFLARGHLVADGDFIPAYEQLATYYYVNAAPQFQAVNGGNWLRVETLARTVAASRKYDIESYTGYMGILTLAKNNGDLVEIYLDNAKAFKVPKYFYKVLIHRPTSSAIVFVTVNNPFLKVGPLEEICTNICEIAGLKHANFPDVTKGYTFCCELNEFKKLVPSLPTEVVANNLLILKR